MSGIFYKIKRQLLSERFNGKKYMVGLLKDKEDERDLKLGINFFGYEPKSSVKVIQTKSIKDQHNNTCGQESYTVQAEVQEDCELSEQSQTCFMRKDGLIEEDGFSSLKGNQQSGIKNGICEKKYLKTPEEQVGWEQYSNVKNLTPEVVANSSLHKAKNYASVIGRSARLKALDDGFILHTGMDWYSGFNISGGFTAPWIIKENKGWLVGGHALAMIGYDMPRSVYIIQNSYSADWGGYVDSLGTKHPGTFAVDMDFFDKYGHACYQRIDLEESLDTFVAQYEGKDVKATGRGIFRIKNGTKCPYPDSVTFFAYGGKYGKWGKTYVDISGTLLDRIPLGEVMDIANSPYWPFIKDNYPLFSVLSEPQNLEVIKQAIDFANSYSTKISSMVKKLGKKYGALSSSVNPQQLSMTIKGILTALVPVIIAFANLRGITLDNEVINAVVNFIVDFVFYGATLVSMVITAYGAIRKAIVWWKNR